MPQTTVETMKAVRIHAYGGPETLVFEDAPVPEPAANELLIRVAAAGVNPVDWKVREGLLGQEPMPQVMGIDFSGVVEQIGSDPSVFAVGDEVLGEVGDNGGSYCEFTTAPTSSVARKPAALSHVQAAALPVVSLTAWQMLFEAGHLQIGQRVLIHAAAGGVGSFAVQFAKSKGAYVIGTASAASVNHVRMLGADQVIDYRSTRFEDAGTGKTRVTVSWLPHNSDEAGRKAFDSARAGMEHGFAGMWTKLESYLAGL